MLIQQVRSATNRAAAPLSIIGAVGGFVGDVLQPLGNFAPWVAILSLLVFIGTLVTFRGMRNRAGMESGESIMPGLLVVSAGSTVIFGLWAVIFAAGPERGYLAENVDPIAQIQASLLNLEEDVAEIKETTAETAENVETIATAQAQGFADIQAAFASLQSSQTIIENPTTPQEWYSNARIYQLKGDTANAITAYEGFFTFNLEYVDPYQEYAKLLTATEGIARARQQMSDLLGQYPDNRVLDMVVGTLFDLPEQRLERLNALAQRAPEFAPVFYELGQEHSSQLRQSFTQNSADSQVASFNRLTELEQQQQAYSRYFIDKSLAQTNLENAQVLMESYTAFTNLDVSFLAFFSYEGLRVSVLLPEGNAQKLLFSLDDPEPKNETGSIAAAGFTTVNTTIGPIPLEKGTHTLYVQYVDANGVASKVYPYEYTVEDIVVNYTQMPFDFSVNGIPGVFVLTIVDGNAEDLYTVNYSLDSDALDQSVQGLASAAVINLSPLETGDHVLYMQGVGPNGEKTDVVQFPFIVQ